MLTLDETTHEYQVGGRAIPSVTQIISTIQLWRGIPPDVLEHARVRGSRVDDAVNQFDAGRLDIDGLEDEIVPYVMAWKDFKISTKCTVLASQVLGYNDVYWYAGTLDKIVQFRRGPPVLIEIKA
ncbi:MAG: hypothetical protein L0Z53_25035, partial [Acidobacteriales bacterium]|nr:hypothetical protein [Terriglobales bacterium]